MNIENGMNIDNWQNFGNKHMQFHTKMKTEFAKYNIGLFK